MSKRYTLQDAIALMAALRTPTYGCAWDAQQTMESIIPYTLEEVYELAEAIADQKDGAIKKELGDVLFQVLFFAQIAEDEQRFTLDDVADALVKKMVFRHPHVFPDGSLSSFGQCEAARLEAVGETWAGLKAKEQNALAEGKVATDEVKGQKANRDEDQPSTQAYTFDEVSFAAPAHTVAYQLQKKAAEVGFDFPDMTSALAKLQEEVQECQEALIERDRAAQLDELGDVLFSAINIARKLGATPEEVLLQSNQKFRQRMNAVESVLRQQGKTLKAASLKEMDEVWSKIKT
ncbi:MAG: nucleoside triphosphate pyrophosphohydrolase [Pseudomonadota bacterium]|nr:nucleoside triphosphate pyrophosphohydrolase [Pseudomonadota bacterium]